MEKEEERGDNHFLPLSHDRRTSQKEKKKNSLIANSLPWENKQKEEEAIND